LASLVFYLLAMLLLIVLLIAAHSCASLVCCLFLLDCLILAYLLPPCGVLTFSHIILSYSSSSWAALACLLPFHGVQ